MWFAFGIVTLLVGSATSWYARVHHRWKGQAVRVDGHGVERRIGRSKTGAWMDRLGIAVPDGSPFRLRREGAHDRFFARLGIAAELPLRDRHLDGLVYLESEDRAIARWIDGDGELARELAALCAYEAHGHRVARVERVGARLWLVLDKVGDASPEAAMLDLAPRLATVAAWLQRAGPRSVERDAFVRRAALVLALNTGVALAGAALLVGTGLHYELLEPGRFFLATLPASLAALVLFAIAAFRWLGRTSRTHLVLIEIALVGTAGFLALGYGLARAANASWDDAPAQVLEIAEFDAVRYACGKGKRSTCHQLRLPPLPELRGDSELDIDSFLYADLERATAVRLRLKPGGLGAAWIESIEPVADAR
jgi:hypothetical protein